MADTPEKNSGAEEEPQKERGPKVTRGTGSDRPPGTSGGRSGTSVQPERTQDPKSPAFQPGGG
ncbi:hypothetical protein ACWD4K_30455 [Streptomyces gelaticus]